MVLSDQVSPGTDRKIIRVAMAQSLCDLLSSENRQQIDHFFNQFLPKGKKKVVRERIEGEIEGAIAKDIDRPVPDQAGLPMINVYF
jgi:hypothetical protein